MAIFDIEGNAIGSAFDVGGNGIATAYNVNGDAFSLGGRIPIDYKKYEISRYLEHRQQQGSAYYGGFLFLFTAGSGCYIIDTSTGDEYRAGVDGIGHGNSASFSDVFYEENDEFPLLYLSPIISTDGVVFIRVYRITRSNNGFLFTLVQSLKFSCDDAGWYAQGVVDNDNNILYNLGFNEQVYDGGSPTAESRTVLTAWDLNDLTDNGDGTFTPTKIGATITTNYFLMNNQGMQFSNGYIFTASADAHGVSIIDPNTGKRDFFIATLPSSEIEGMVFLTPYEMVIGYFNHDWMYKYIFSA